MATKAREIGRLFSPLQVGFIADCVEPLSAGSEAGWALEMLADRPDLEVIPIEREGAVIGVVPRHVLEELVESAWKRFWQKDLDAYMIPARKTVEATDYVDRVVAETLAEPHSNEPEWYIIQHHRSYLGIISLKQMLEYLNELRAQDLRRAGEIQQYLLSKPLPEDSRFKLYFYNRMAHEVGGDFYRAASIGDDRYLIACFDVAGKNISGSLATTALGAFFSSLRLLGYEGDGKKTTGLINTLIKEVSPEDVFVAAVLFYIDFSTMTVEIHNCGFSPVLAFVPQEEGRKIICKMAKPNLPPLGIEDKLVIEVPLSVPIVKGLRLSAYSDGLTDMRDSFGEQYGEDKTVEFLRLLHTVPTTEYTERIDTEINKWIGESYLADDITLVDIRFV